MPKKLAFSSLNLGWRSMSGRKHGVGIQVRHRRITEPGFLVLHMAMLECGRTWSRRQESNLYLALRRHSFYPLNYGETLLTDDGLQTTA
jgi:hypothetical protein